MTKAYKVTFDSEYYRYYENIDNAEKFANENGLIIVRIDNCEVDESWVY